MDIYTIFWLQYSLFWCEISVIYRLYILLNRQLSHTIFVNMPGMRVENVKTIIYLDIWLTLLFRAICISCISFHLCSFLDIPWECWEELLGDVCVRACKQLLVPWEVRDGKIGGEGHLNKRGLFYGNGNARGSNHLFLVEAPILVLLLIIVETNTNFLTNTNIIREK